MKPLHVVLPLLLLAVVFFGYHVLSSRQPRLSSAHAHGTTTLAIMPIRNLGSGETSYLADGLTDDLIAQASKISDLRVISRLSMMQFKGSDTPPREIASQLGASAILEGSMRWTDEHFHVAVSLIQPDEGIVLWAETYSGPVTDIFRTQEDIVRRITANLEVDIDTSESNALATVPSQSAEAYSRYHKAREYYYRYTRDDNEYAISLFQAALREDARYADAWAGLADAYSQRAIRHGFAQAWHDSAIAICQEALQIDSTNAAVYKALGLAYLGKGLFREALAANRNALRFSPNHYPAATNAGMICLLIGEVAEALRYHLDAATLAPTQGMTAAYVANDYALLGLDQCAGAWFDRSLEIQPDLSPAWALRAYWQLALGNGQAALADCREALARDTSFLTLKLAGDAALLSNRTTLAQEFYLAAPDYVSQLAVQSWIPYAFVLLEAGKADSARTILDRCLRHDLANIERGNESFEPRHRIATVHLLRSDVEEALVWYRDAIEHGWRNCRLDSYSPLFGAVRQHPEFRALRDSVAQTLDSLRATIDTKDCGGIT
jgi:TolB-like protein/tetratricopeptide (TPR) repeat protein